MTASDPTAISPDAPLTALVMAASRKGPTDSVAQLQNKPNKCLVEIGGQVMLERVVEALVDSGCFARIYVSIETEDLLRATPRLEGWMDDGLLHFVASAGNIANSVIAAVDAIDDLLPFVITTGDNALHTPDIIRDFVAAFRAGSGDVAVAFTERETVLQDFPEPGLAFHDLTDGGWSACNLYGMRNEQSLASVRVFEGGGQFGKKHMRILKAFGIMPFVLYKLKMVSMPVLMSRIGRGLKVSVDSIVLPYSFGPIDVDNPASFALTEEALKKRRLGQ